MKLLIKVGGSLLDVPNTVYLLARQIADLAHAGHKLVVVHGGGKRLSRYLAERGVESHFVNGFRVTTPEVLDGVIKVLAGEVNLELVAALQCEGAGAVGLTGADSGLAQAVPLSPELGAVGRIHQVQSKLLDLLTAEGYLPVVACLAAGYNGEIYNVNADQMAAACAATFQADRLIFLTDVEGVLDRDKRLIQELTAGEGMALIERGIATGGMEAKLRACASAVQQGVPEVRIAAGTGQQILERLLSGRSDGTTVTPGIP